MKRLVELVLLVILVQTVQSQTPPVNTSADIYLQLKKLNVLGSVLYIAAHPDDENTRLLAWLSKERLYRTGYLSITRGDGGQNLIGDEQGIDLGLIRTQELLSARRIDGAEQFFTRAYDFGFSKTTSEAFEKWDKEKILSDVVWIIRKFQPDVVIARFPEDGRAGHGHHSGSAVLAREAFKAAADPSRFPEQLKFGVKPWQPVRIVWNTFNFGNTNTTNESQLKIDVGAYNAILGKSYGELAAESRSQHKSQGFGVPASRGAQFEYFTPVDGSVAKTDIMDDVVTTWSKLPGAEELPVIIDNIIRNYSLSKPGLSVPSLVSLYKKIQQLPDGFWKNKKLEETQRIIEQCSGLWLEATANNEYAVQGDSIRLSVSVNNRSGVTMSMVKIMTDGFDSTMNQLLELNKNYFFTKPLVVSMGKKISQPYWLEQKMSEGSFNVNEQTLIGMPQNNASILVDFDLVIEGQLFRFTKPAQYKYTDPVRGELYQPLVVVPPVAISTEPGVVIFRKNEDQKATVLLKVTAHRNFSEYAIKVSKRMRTENSLQVDSPFTLTRGLTKDYLFSINNKLLKESDQDYVQAFTELRKGKEEYPAYLNITSIKYDHIPHIHYMYQDAIKILNMDLKTVGKKIGYIEGAGDKVMIALQQMGYEVMVLKEKDIVPSYLKQFDAIITGVRAYNVNDFMAAKYEVLMNYVKEGGNLIAQYSTNNFISNVKAKIGPYPLTISRSRVTDERAKVNILLPEHPVLNYPNKIIASDFEGWLQERSIYNAEQLDSAYEKPLSMADPGEKDQEGSLVIASYGKGKFVYTGLVFFRELPAGIPGAYRLLANIIALNRKKAF
ncbi:MAG: PIG-L family deacetylase [Chitinophagaceae bacterium]